MSLSRCPKGSFDLAHFNRDLRIHLLIGKGHLITHPPFHFYFPVYSKWRSPPPSPRRSFGADLEIRRHGLSPGGLCSRLPSFYCKAPASWASLSRIPSWAPPPAPPSPPLSKAVVQSYRNVTCMQALLGVCPFVGIIYKETTVQQKNSEPKGVALLESCLPLLFPPKLSSRVDFSFLLPFLGGWEWHWGWGQKWPSALKQEYVCPCSLFYKTHPPYGWKGIRKREGEAAHL